jgi:hypothetical protein
LVDFPLDEFAGNGRKLFSVMFVGHENIGLITEKPTIRSYFVNATAAARLLYSRSQGATSNGSDWRRSNGSMLKVLFP